MQALRFCAWGAFALAGLLVLLGAGNGSVMTIAVSVSTAIAGVLFLALDRVIELLEAIRAGVAPAADHNSAETTPEKPLSAPTRSLDELAAEIDRKKAKTSANGT